jgi:hypothetical protein
VQHRAARAGLVLLPASFVPALSAAGFALR